MEITFKTKKLQKICSDRKAMVKRWGNERAKKIARRLGELRAAPNLGEMRNLPGRCHELTGDRSGQLSIDLEGPYRLFFEPVDDPPPARPDGGLDWEAVTVIRVVEVGDPHGD